MAENLTSRISGMSKDELIHEFAIASTQLQEQISKLETMVEERNQAIIALQTRVETLNDQARQNEEKMGQSRETGNLIIRQAREEANDIVNTANKEARQILDNANKRGEAIVAEKTASARDEIASLEEQRSHAREMAVSYLSGILGILRSSENEFSKYAENSNALIDYVQSGLVQAQTAMFDDTQEELEFEQIDNQMSADSEDIAVLNNLFGYNDLGKDTHSDDGSDQSGKHYMPQQQSANRPYTPKEQPKTTAYEKETPKEEPVSQADTDDDFDIDFDFDDNQMAGKPAEDDSFDPDDVSVASFTNEFTKITDDMLGDDDFSFDIDDDGNIVDSAENQPQAQSSDKAEDRTIVVPKKHRKTNVGWFD